MKNIVIVDIDGTIARVGDRLECLQRKPKNWDEFYDRCDEDKPIQEIIGLINAMCVGFFELGLKIEIVFCTGRKEAVRDKTIKWIDKHFTVFNYRLLMRKDGDFRHDTVAKPELLEEAGIKLEDIAYVLEDRDSMVKKWRELGLTCLQVANGDF